MNIARVQTSEQRITKVTLYDQSIKDAVKHHLKPNKWTDVLFMMDFRDYNIVQFILRHMLYSRALLLF